MSGFDERAHAGPEHLDPGYVATYDRKSGRDDAAELALLRRAGLDATSTLVDLGAGTGRTVLAAAPACRRAIAVDVSAPMLHRLRAEAARRGLANVRCVEAGFLTYEHEGEPPAVVHSRNALHHLPDDRKPEALERVARLLAPGGRFVLRDLVFSFEPAEAGTVLEAWYAGAAPTRESGWTRDELETHVRTEFSPYARDLEAMLESAGLRIVEAEHDARRTYSLYVCAGS
jgi:ubiquinone/menaquinone biosynthesis C-methylase UbiE